MTEHVPEPEFGITAESIRETLDGIVPYIEVGVLRPQLVSAPQSKLFLIESPDGMLVVKPGGNEETVKFFVSNQFLLAENDLLAGDAREAGIEVDPSNLVLTASVPLDRRPDNEMRLVADFKKASFKFIDDPDYLAESDPPEATSRV